MDRLGELEALLVDLKAVTVATARGAFTGLFQRGCALLAFGDREAVRIFCASQPTVNRWRHGKIVPGVPALVLRALQEEVVVRIRYIQRMETVGAADE